MRGSTVITIRSWHRGNKGSYEKFKAHYADRPWIGSVSKKDFEYYKTAPVQRPNQSRVAGGTRKYARAKKPKVYVTVFKKGKAELGAGGVDAIKALIHELGEQNKASMEVVEYVDGSVEVREVAN